MSIQSHDRARPGSGHPNPRRGTTGSLSAPAMPCSHPVAEGSASACLKAG